MVNPLNTSIRRTLIIFLALLITGCSFRPPSMDGAPAGGMDRSQIRDAVPRAEPRSRSGNPSSYTVLGRTYHVMGTSRGYHERGAASWYGTKFHGQRTSSGETYNMYAMTAAHKTLPLPTYVRVTNLQNGREVIVKVNDRGPFHDNRVIDLSYAAATKLGITGNGTGLVEVEALDSNNGRPRPTRNNIALSGKNTILYLQVGAFRDRNNAERMAQRLRGSIDNSIRIQTAASYTQTLYRVQVGPMHDIEQADAASMRLAQLGIRDMHLIIK
jgi:peptidoglycan lytic transglycosylase